MPGALPPTPRPPHGAADGTLEAARSVLATLTAGRAALLHLAAAHLPFERLIALHHGATPDVVLQEDLGILIERRLALHRRPLGSDGAAPSLPSSYTLPRAASAEPPAPSARPAASERPAPAVRSNPADALRAFAAAATRSTTPRPPGPPAEPPRPPKTPPIEPPQHPPAPPVEPPPMEAPPVEPPPMEAPPVSPPPASPPPPIRAEPTAAPATIAPPPADDLSEWAASALGGTPAAPAAPVERSRVTPAVTPEPTPAEAPAPAPARSRSDHLAVVDGVPFVPLSELPLPDLLVGFDTEAPHEHSILDLSTLGYASNQARIGSGPIARLAPDEDEDEGDEDEDEPSLAVLPAESIESLAASSAPSRADAVDPSVFAAGEETAEDIQPGTGHTVRGSLSVMRDHRSERPARPSAPRLTDDDPADHTQPSAAAPPPRAALPDDKQIQALLSDAHAHARRGEFQKAIQLYTDVLDMRYNLVDAHIGRGRCHLELGDYSSAMSDFARAEDHAPDRPDSHVAMGDLYFARKEYKRAIEFYDQAVEIDGGHAMARCRRGISHYYRKNYRQAYQDLQRALALDPEIPNMRKYVQMAQKKLERGE